MPDVLPTPCVLSRTARSFLLIDASYGAPEERKFRLRPIPDRRERHSARGMESEPVDCLPEGGKLLRVDEWDPRSVPVDDFLRFPIYPESILRVHSPASIQQKFL